MDKTAKKTIAKINLKGLKMKTFNEFLKKHDFTKSTKFSFFENNKAIFICLNDIDELTKTKVKAISCIFNGYTDYTKYEALSCFIRKVRELIKEKNYTSLDVVFTATLDELKRSRVVIKDYGAKLKKGEILSVFMDAYEEYEKNINKKMVG